MRIIITFLALFFFVSLNAQHIDNTSAIVKSIDETPIYIYSKPVQNHEVVGNATSFSDAIKILANEKMTFDEKIAAVIKASIKRKEKGKLGDYNAIVFDSEKEKVLAINFSEKVSVRAHAELIDSTIVFFYSQPEQDYEAVDTLVADYSLYAKRNGVFAKIESMVHKTEKKAANGEIEDFDAVIINSNDLSDILIKFKK